MLKVFKDWTLVIAIILGVLIHPWAGNIAFLSPYLISAMLVFTFSSTPVRQLKIEKTHLLLLVLQLVLGITFYVILKPFNTILAMGALVCALCPTATAAPAIVRMLGGNVAYIATYLLLINLAMALIMPICFAFVIHNNTIHFGTMCFGIMKRVGVLLLMPLILARIIKHICPKANEVLINHSHYTFYIWACALVIAIANTIRFFKINEVDNITLLLMGGGSLIVCLLQFVIGRLCGRHYSNKVAMTQTFGQKNTILAIWMSQTFLNPLCSTIPAFYILWQNLINSYQLYKHRKSDEG